MRRLFAAACTVGSCLSHAALAADLPKISVMTIDANASEAGSDAASFMILREAAPIDKPLTVFFTISGMATNGADYASVGTSMTFAPQSPIGTVTIKPIADALTEGMETVILTLNAKPGVYTLGDPKSGDATISDAPPGGGAAPGEPASGANTPSNPRGPSGPSGASSPGGPNAASNPNSTNGANSVPSPNHASRLPLPDRTGTLFVTMTFDGLGKWKHPSNGAFSDLKFHRVLTYTIPLRGTYSPGSGFDEIDKRELKGPLLPNFKRFLILEPRDRMAPMPRVCGKGTTVFEDSASGMQVGDPGQPPLVPFTETIRGGGTFPSGDKSVPERDLCLTKVTLDFEKHVFHMVLDGSDSNVKVTNVHNGHASPPYNLPLQGYDNGAAKAKLTWFDMPLGKGRPDTVSGARTFVELNMVSAGMSFGSKYPLRARIEYQLTLSP